MVHVGAHDEFKKVEHEFAKRGVGWDAPDDAICAAARLEYVKLARIKREKQLLRERLGTGGRKRNKAHGIIIDDIASFNVIYYLGNQGRTNKSQIIFVNEANNAKH